MDSSRKKELLMNYKNRKPDMGIIEFCCIATQDRFFHPSKDTKAEMNSHRFRLDLGKHPNKALQAQWKEHGAVQCKIEVVEVLPYDEKKPDKDYTEDLENLCDKHIASHDGAARLMP